MSLRFTDVYEQVELLGTGNFGKIYTVVEKVAGKIYACKEVFLPKLPSDLVEAQLREISFLRALKHPNIVPIIDSYYEDDYVYILMPFFERGDLNAHRKRYKLTEKEILIILVQLLQALAFLHGARGSAPAFEESCTIVHRDIKPANVLIGEDNIVILTDFGLSKIIDKATNTQTIAGSLAYIAPEMHARVGYTEAIDIWSLGVSIYELLSDGKPLINSFFSTHILQEIERWERPLIIPNASEELSHILNKMLAYKPEDRPSALDLLSMPVLQNIRRTFLEEAPFNASRAECLSAYIRTTPSTYLKDWDSEGNNIVMRCLLKGSFYLVRELSRVLRGELNSKGQTSLMIAAELNNLEAIKELISTQKGRRDDRHVTDIRGKTALMYAAEKGDTCVTAVRLLKDSEAKIMTPERWTALMFAAAGGSSRVVAELIDSETRMTNNTGQTALMIAAAANQEQVVHQLLKTEARRKDFSGKTALMYAAMNGHVNCVAILREYEARMRDKDKMTALAYAITRRHIDAAILLIPYEENILIKKKTCYRMSVELALKDLISHFSTSMPSSTIAAHVNLDKSNLSVQTFSSISSVSTSVCDLSYSVLDSRV